MIWEDESEGSAATAAARVAYSPEVVVLIRTIFAPEGGEVREEGGESANPESGRNARMEMRKRIYLVRQHGLAEDFSSTLLKYWCQQPWRSEGYMWYKM